MSIDSVDRKNYIIDPRCIVCCWDAERFDLDGNIPGKLRKLNHQLAVLSLTVITLEESTCSAGLVKVHDIVSVTQAIQNAVHIRKDAVVGAPPLASDVINPYVGMVVTRKPDEL